MDDRVSTVTYSSDYPIRSKREDRFNRAPFAARVADTTATRTDPSSIVIGLYGPWGGGKSSTLNLMEEALAAHSNVVVVRFNPWLFNGEDQLLRGFFDALAATLDGSLQTAGEKIGRLLRDYGAVLSQASFSTAGMVRASPGRASKGIDDSPGGVRLDQLRDRVEKLLQLAGRRVVVLIDDIDRLDRTEMHAVFKLVKLSASFANSSYVLSFDDEMVASSIGERYTQAGYEAGRNYLAKIIQVPLHLPPPDTMQLRQMVFDGVEAALRQCGIELGQEDADAFAHHFVAGLEPRLGTPRHAKLYVNAVTFALPLLKGEAHPVDLLLMEGIRIYYPRLYVAIRDNADLFLGGGRDSDQNTESARRRRIADLIGEVAGDITAEQNASLRGDLLETLFPRLRTTRYGHEWEPHWAREQRICSEQYFQRYFTYSVPPGDIGDLEVKSFLNEVAALDAPASDAALEAFARRDAFPRLVQKLHRAAPTLPEEVASALALAIARNASLAHRERRQASLLDSTFSHATHLVTSLVKQVRDVRARDRIALAIAETAEPLTFASECLRCMRRTADHAEEDQILSQDGDQSMRLALVDRIRSQAAAGSLHRTFGRDAHGLYWLWAQQSAAEAASDLRGRLQEDPVEVDALVDSFAGEAGGQIDGLSQDADISREAYDAIAQLIDPQSVAEALMQRHGSDLGSGDFYRHDTSDTARRIAHQFVWMHRRVAQELAEQAAATSSSDADDAWRDGSSIAAPTPTEDRLTRAPRSGPGQISSASHS
jgi:hypothetical protein